MMKTLKYQPFITEESLHSSNISNMKIDDQDYSRNINPMVNDTP